MPQTIICKNKEGTFSLCRILLMMTQSGDIPGLWVTTKQESETTAAGVEVWTVFILLPRMALKGVVTQVSP